MHTVLYMAKSTRVSDIYGFSDVSQEADSDGRSSDKKMSPISLFCDAVRYKVTMGISIYFHTVSEANGKLIQFSKFHSTTPFIEF